MKKNAVVFGGLCLVAGLCAAQEQGRVISSTPIMQQVAVPRQVCTTDQVGVQAPKSGAGAAIGAIAGGVIGNAMGQGSGRAAATAIGLIGGAVLGDHIEGSNAQVQNVQRCTTQSTYENRAVGFSVVYEYGGRQYTTQMATDPGQYVQLQVTPVGPSAPAPQALVQQPPTYVQAAPTVVYTAAPVYYAQPYYAQPYYYPPIVASIGFGYYGGWRGGHGGHGHWR